MPRAELLAVIEGLLEIPVDHPVLIVVDALVVIKGMLGGSGDKHADNVKSEWGRFWHAGARREVGTHCL